MRITIQSTRLTSKEAARLLGVSEASVKRWADTGLLPMEKTAGGHRRFRPEDVAILRREGWSEDDSHHLKKRIASRPAEAATLDPGRELTLVEETFEALMEGRDEEVSALFTNLYLQGQTVGAIADRLVCAAMRRVGDLWHQGKLSIVQEHVATRTALSALQNLHAALDAPQGEPMMSLCCSTEEDFHELPVQLTVLTLKAGGMEVFNLGTNTPFYALTEAVERFKPHLVCVSSTILNNLDRAAREYIEFHRTTRRTRASVVLGGQGFADTILRQRFPADLYADSFEQLTAFVREMVVSQTIHE